MALFTINGVAGGATSSTGTAVGGVGSSPTITAGTGGAATSSGTTATVGGAGGSINLNAGPGGNGNLGNDSGGAGGSITLTPGAGGSKTGTGTAGAAGKVVVANTSLQVPAGSSTSPSFQFSGMGATTGFFLPSQGPTWDVSNSAILTFGNTGAVVGSGGSWQWTSSTSIGTVDTGFSRDAAGVVSVDGSAIDNSSGLLRSANACRITSAITLSTSVTALCTWNLPAAVRTWAWTCTIPYSVTAGTAVTLSLYMDASQAPSNETGYASIFNSNAGGSTQGTHNYSTSGSNLIFTGPTTGTNGTFLSMTSGTIQASATLGTFAIQALFGGGGTPAVTIPVGANCLLY